MSILFTAQFIEWIVSDFLEVFIPLVAVIGMFATMAVVAYILDQTEFNDY